MNAPLPSEHAETYRQRVVDVLDAINRYTGTESEYRGVMDMLVGLEQWMVRTFGGVEGRKPSRKLEQQLSQEYLPGEKTTTISRLLSLAHQRLSKILQGKLSPDQIAKQLGILLVTMNETILPPGESGGIRAGSEEGIRPREYAPRLQELIAFLEQHEIFTDDLVLIRGVNLPHMIRRESYVLVEVPRLGKQILVCNEIGEAMFVSERILSRELFFQDSKEELLQHVGVHRVTMHNPGQWQQELSRFLFREGETIGCKVNVRDREQCANAIREQWTLERWLAMTKRQKFSLEVHGRKYHAIATIFGHTDPKSKQSCLTHLELAAKIFGEDIPTLQLLLEHERQNARAISALGNDSDRWSALIQSKITAEQWVAMQSKERNSIDFFGLGKKGIARIFGFQTTNYTHLAHLEVGAKIYGADHPVIVHILSNERRNIQKQDEFGRDQNKWREEICTMHTPETWVAMPSAARNTFSIYGVGFDTLRGIFGLPHGKNLADHIEFGRKIFGENAMKPFVDPDRASQVSEQLGEDPERWKAAIMERVTAEAWVAMSSQQIVKFSICGKKLFAISRFFGWPAKKYKGNRYSFLEFGALIFGENHPALRAALIEARSQNELEKNSEKFRELIKSEYTPERWLGISYEERRKFQYHGMGMRALATIFGMAGADPMGVKSHFLELSARIFGEEHPAIRSLFGEERRNVEKLTLLGRDPDLWRVVLKERNSIEEWVGWGYKERHAFKIFGKGLDAIATIFDIQGNVKSINHLYFELVAKIFGEDDPVFKPMLEASRRIQSTLNTQDNGSETK